MIKFAVPARLQSQVEQLAASAKVRPTKLIHALVTLAIERPEAVMSSLSLRPTIKKQEVAMALRAELDVGGSPPLTERDVQAMLFNYGAKGQAALEKHKPKLVDEAGRYVEARVVKLVRALAEAKWTESNAVGRRGVRAFPPHTVIGKRYGSTLVLAAIDRHNPPDGAEFIRTIPAAHTWALCRCDCGNWFYHAVSAVSTARCGGKHQPRNTYHWEPNLQHECPLTPRKTIPSIGRVFNHLTVIGKGTAKGKLTVQCRCGVIKQVHATALYSGRTKSCGCWQAARMSAVTTKDTMPPIDTPVAADIDDLD